MRHCNQPSSSAIDFAATSHPSVGVQSQLLQVVTLPLLHSPIQPADFQASLNLQDAYLHEIRALPSMMALNPNNRPSMFLQCHSTCGDLSVEDVDEMVLLSSPNNLSHVYAAVDEAGTGDCHQRGQYQSFCSFTLYPVYFVS